MYMLLLEKGRNSIQEGRCTASKTKWINADIRMGCNRSLQGLGLEKLMQMNSGLEFLGFTGP